MKKAFTLIELLVVVLIIGILSAVALPQYQKAVGKTRTTEALITLNALLQTEQRYYLANGTYTTDLTDLDIEIPTSDYYSYTVQPEVEGGASWRIFAIRQKNYLPSFETNLRKATRWCYAGITNATARNICSTLGTEDHTVSSQVYYKMN